MRVITYAFAVGRGREVAARLFADGFARGRDLSIRAHILDAASRAGLDRSAPDGGALELFWGDDRLEDAVACLLSVGPAT